jgi:hypothetical protein
MGGHYFRAAMDLHAKPMWYALPKPGENRCANEGFIQIGTKEKPAWLLGFGRQDGTFACLNVSDGSVRWTMDIGGSATDVVACDMEGDGREEFIFGTSHGALYAVGDEGGKPRVVWKMEVGTGLVGSPVLADLDGDGKTDVVIPAVDGRVRIFRAQKDDSHRR